jgi:hypothetical protein
VRYYGCNCYYGLREKDFKNWIVNTFNGRKKNGLKPIPPHFERSGEVTLVDGSKLWPEQLLLIEPAQM